MTVPELGRLLGLDRRQAWKLHTKVKSAFVTIRVAGKPRVTKQSFESWYQNQAEYTKVTVQASDGFSCAVNSEQYYQDIAFAELDMLIGKLKGTTKYKALNTIDELTNTEKRILERVIQTIDSLGIDGSDTIIEAIINEFATK